MTDGEARGQCPLCGTTKCLEVREASDPRFGLPGRFKVLWCPKCDIGSTHPRLTWTELQRYYPDAYDPYRGHTWLSEISRVHRFLIAAEDRFGRIEECGENIADQQIVRAVLFLPFELVCNERQEFVDVDRVDRACEELRQSGNRPDRS